MFADSDDAENRLPDKSLVDGIVIAELRIFCDPTGVRRCPIDNLDDRT